MLIITRRAGERIMVGDDVVVVEIMEIVGNSVRVGISAPRSVPVYREEIWEAVKAEEAGGARREPGRRRRLVGRAPQARTPGPLTSVCPAVRAGYGSPLGVLRANPRERDPWHGEAGSGRQRC